MKQHLISLLMIEHLHEVYFTKLEKAGVKMESFGNYSILEVVLDIVGFPRDNTLIYDFQYLNTGKRGDDPSLKIPDEEMFCRDWLTEEWFQVTTNQMPAHDIKSGPEGIVFTDPESEDKCTSAISTYVDWLFKEFEEWSKDWTTSVTMNFMSNDEA
jgi:hypothetical protein